MAELLEGLGVSGKKVCVLTAEYRPEIYLSGRNIPGVHVMRYGDATAHDLLWAEALVVEEAAVGGHALAKAAGSTREKRAQKAGRKPAGRAAAKSSAKAKTSAKKAAKKPAAKKPAAKPAKKSKKGGGDA
jgi:hypothetical protein